MNTVLSSCIFHTLEEARDYQGLNGVTLNIITNSAQICEIVDTCELQDSVAHPDF
jgi:hypothetical protein